MTNVQTGLSSPTDGRRQRVLAHLAMLLFAACIALGFSLSALIKNDISTVPLNAARFFLGTLLMGPAALAAGRGKLAIPTAPWRFGLLGLLSAVYFITMYIALTVSPPIAISAVFTLIPLMAAAIAFVLLRQRVRPMVAFSLLLAGLGSLWVIFHGSVAYLIAFDVGRGEIIFFAGCACYALYTVLLRRLSRGEPSLVVSFWTLLATTAWVCVYGIGDLQSIDWLHLPVQIWEVIAYLSIFPTAITFFLLQFAALRLPSAKVIAYGYLTPTFVILFEGLLGHGWPSLPVVGGAGVTMLALLVLGLIAD